MSHVTLLTVVLVTLGYLYSWKTMRENTSKGLSIPYREFSSSCRGRNAEKGIVPNNDLKPEEAGFGEVAY